ncbi:DUF1993 domain-containing protein [Telluria aromaticivorans]|uniref:DUF1993 domain-containing protein n=1 Tax=Telluria aromaticivorans TaxID=2725995 RepID=A0A7Y2P0D1_9BURK|nr:DUF1993 domain-containing protein [Telluria aromaticivorans]NNG23426.1 DUF1993 domain-containing protein [Telluria aromaticivorans]
MSLTMYSASVPVFRRTLGSLAAVLETAETHAQQHKIEPVALLQARLFPDMFPLIKQVQVATDFAKGASARLAGQEVPRYEDNEQTFAELQQRITKTLGYIESLPEEDIAASGERPVTHGAGERARHFDSGDAYLVGFVLPNFYFHVTTAYAILRHNGVPIGKRDFLGVS